MADINFGWLGDAAGAFVGVWAERPIPRATDAIEQKTIFIFVISIASIRLGQFASLIVVELPLQIGFLGILREVDSFLLYLDGFLFLALQKHPPCQRVENGDVPAIGRFVGAGGDD